MKNSLKKCSMFIEHVKSFANDFTTHENGMFMSFLKDNELYYKQEKDKVLKIIHSESEEILNISSGDEDAIPNTVVRRDASADVSARLFRSEYAVLNSNIQHVMTQINQGENNHIRPSSIAQLATAVEAQNIDAATVNGHTDEFLMGVVPSGATTKDPNTVLKSYCLLKHANTPTPTEFWHIRTQFYANNTATNSRSQIAIQYNGGNAAYVRSFHQTVWQQWVRIDNNIDAIQSNMEAVKATATQSGAIKMRIDGTTLYLTNDGTNA